MKATKAGRVVGMALEAFSGASGQVMVRACPRAQRRVNTWYEPGVLTVLACSTAAPGCVGKVGIGQVNPGATLDVNGDGRFANALTVAAGGIQVTGNSTISGDVNVTGTGTFKNLVATDSLKIGAAGTPITQLNHGTVPVSLNIPAAVLDVNAASFTRASQSVGASIPGCTSNARLLAVPQGGLPDGVELSKVQCTGAGAASLVFTNYETSGKTGSVSISYEVIQ